MEHLNKHASNPFNESLEELEPPRKLGDGVHNRSRQRLEQLKQDYKSAFMDDMFPTKQWSDYK